jgi:hypothetical protein
MVEQLRDDIRRFIAANNCSRAVAVWCGSTEVYVSANGVHHTVETFEKALHHDDPDDLELAAVRVGLSGRCARRRQNARSADRGNAPHGVREGSACSAQRSAS